MGVRGSVLVVDDEDVIRRILMITVRRAGFSVTEAVDGLDALNKMKDAKFDFVISDIKMPNMNGLELLKEIKANYPDTIVFLITGYGSEYDIKDIMAAGAHHFITKPFHNVEISHILKGFFQRKLAAKV